MDTTRLSSLSAGGRESSKRPMEDHLQEANASKRGRYVPSACENCRRRKVKCDGKTPCQRCSTQPEECVYRHPGNSGGATGANNEDKVQRLELQIQALQDKLGGLLQFLGPLAGAQGQIHEDGLGHASLTASIDDDLGVAIDAGLPAQEEIGSSTSHDQQPAAVAAKVPPFHGPTTATFPFEQARSSLRELGIGGLKLIDEAVEMPSLDSTASILDMPYHLLQDPAPNDSLLREVGWSETGRLCKSYNESFNSMYPMVDMIDLMAKVKAFFDQQSVSRRDVRLRTHHSTGPLSQHDSVVLKLILATSLVAEAGGQSNLGNKLFANSQSSLHELVWQQPGFRNIQAFALASLYHLALDNYAVMHRVVALAVKLCFELGIHRADVVRQTFPDDKDATLAITTFWSLHMLDRRCSFGTGLPLVVHDSDIDPDLPEPDSSTPYVRIMLDYSRLAEKVLGLNRGLGKSKSLFKREEADHLDYLVLKWQDRIPSTMKFDCPITDFFGGNDYPDQASLYFRVMLRLRGNQLRNVIYRSALCTPQSARESLSDAQMVVDISKDSIQVISHLEKTTDIYRKHSWELNRYLLAALGVLLLSAINAPGVNQHLAGDYHTALGMLESTCSRLGTQHHQSQKLKALKELGPRLSLAPKSLPKAGDRLPNLSSMSGIPDEDTNLLNFTMTDDWQAGEDFLNLLTTSNNW